MSVKELPFSHGRLAFSQGTLALEPCLPETMELRTKLHCLNQDGLAEAGFFDFEDLAVKRAEKDFVWLHLSGSLGDEFWKHLSNFLDLTDEQKKLLRGPHKDSFYEDFHNGIFWSLARPSITERVDAIESINFFMAEKVLITRQFSHDSAFTMVSHKLQEKGEYFANATVDILATELIQDVLNSYVELLKLGGTRLEEIQNKIILKPGKQELEMINRAQQLIWIFLNQVWPIETVLLALERSQNPLMSEKGKTQIGYRKDEAAAVIRLFETYRAMSYNLMDVYVSGLSLRTNKTTTILTMIATLFLPPSLIAGIYGMNFAIPEVHAAFGYYFCLLLMFCVSGSLLFWLKFNGHIELE